MIMAGKVLVNNLPTAKPDKLVSDGDAIVLRGDDLPYVSRGGLKLEGALKSFRIRVEGAVCLDIGASTGGFTDCLLQHGSRRVYAVDVGYGQLAWKLRQDPRVIPIDRANIRYLPGDAIPDPVELATVDVSFISLRTVIPEVIKFLGEDARILALIKPQFEVGKGMVGKGGIVRDPAQHEAVIRELTVLFTEMGLLCEPTVPSPVLGAKGNREFFISMRCPG